MRFNAGSTIRHRTGNGKIQAFRFFDSKARMPTAPAKPVFGNNSHSERVNVKTAQKLEKSRLFWFPTQDMTGVGGMTFGAGLTDP